MKTLIIISMFCLAVTFNVSGQATPQEMLNKAIYEEEVNGNLEEAIKLFLEIVDKNSANRTVTAEAFYHLGLSNEKLGNKKAKEYYEKVVNNFTDQPEFVRIAKERLSKLLVAEKEAIASLIPKFTKIRTPFSIPQWSGSRLSPEGKIMAFGSENEIWTVPIPGNVDPDLAGEPKVLPGTSDVLGAGLSWSGDGKWIAFSRVYINDLRGGGTRIKFNPEGAHIDVLPSKGGEPKRIPVPQWLATNGDTRLQLSLSPDGKLVAFDSGEQVYIASVETGDIRQVTKEGGVSPCFSPDGIKIAYLKPAGMLDNPPSRLAEVWIVSSNGDDPFKVSGDVNRNLMPSGPTWSPNGKMIAFCRIDLGEKVSSKICIIPLSDKYKPLSAPIQIELPVVSSGLITGWTPDNKIGILLDTPYREYIYTVPVNGGKVSQISPLDDFASIPRWSPDGKRIYFRWGKGRLSSVPSDGGELRIHSGVDQMVKNTGFFTIYPGSGNSVSPDGKSIVFSGGTATSGPNIYTIPVEGGEPNQVANGGGYPCWSPNRKWIAYLGRETGDDGKPKEVIFKVSKEGGNPQKITTLTDNVTAAGIDWSPDGKMIAYFAKKENETAGTLRLVSDDGSESREVCPILNVAVHSDVTWSPDGQKIAFVSKGKIWVVPSNGGDPVELWTDVDAHVGALDWSPDGNKIVFSGGSGMKPEFWFMEDFLPLDKLSQKDE